MHAADLLTSRARLTPGREALYELHTGKRYTYDQLNRRANRTANFMRDRLGIQPGERVSILAQNGVAYLDLFFGLAKIGAILAPLNWRLVANELAYILNDCASSVLICGPEFVNVLDEMRPDLKIQDYISLDGAQIEGALTYEELMAAADDSEPELAELDGRTPHCILYTSGTTGRPKGAIIPHDQVIWNCINTIAS